MKDKTFTISLSKTTNTKLYITNLNKNLLLISRTYMIKCGNHVLHSFNGSARMFSKSNLASRSSSTSPMRALRKKRKKRKKGKLLISNVFLPFLQLNVHSLEHLYHLNKLKTSQL